MNKKELEFELAAVRRQRDLARECLALVQGEIELALGELDRLDHPTPEAQRVAARVRLERVRTWNEATVSQARADAAARSMADAVAHRAYLPPKP